MVPVLSGGEWDSTMSVEGHKNQDGEDNQAFMNGISSDYWKTMGVPLLEGRDFDDRDAGKKMTVAIVNRKFATHFFGNKSPHRPPHRLRRRPQIEAGHRDRRGDGGLALRGPARRRAPPGVRAVRAGGLSRPAWRSTCGRPMDSKQHVRGAAAQGAGNWIRGMPVYEMKTLEHQLDETLSTERLIAVLSAAFGVLATVLAALGSVRRHGIHGGAAHQGDRSAHGAGRAAERWSGW